MATDDDKPRELTPDQAADALAEFFRTRGPLRSPHWTGYDPAAAAPSRTVYTCLCGFCCVDVETMMTHVHDAHDDG